MQEYYISTFHIQLINDPQILKDFNNVYLFIQKESKQTLISSTRKRQNTTISFYNEEGFIFSEQELIQTPLKVEIHEYIMDETIDFENYSKVSKIFTKESLLGIAQLSLNQYSTRIYHPVLPNKIVGEFIYTIQPHILQKLSTLKILSASASPMNISQDQEMMGDNKQPTSFNSNQILSKSSASNSLHESSKRQDHKEQIEIVPVNNEIWLSQDQPLANNDLTFLQLLNQQPQTQQILSNEEDSTETPTSKLISSQGDLNSSRQYIPTQMSKSTHVPINDIERKKQQLSISPNRYLVVEKQKMYNEIRTPVSNKNKNIEGTKISFHGSPKDNQKHLQNLNQQFQQQMQIQQQHTVAQSNPQQIQNFTQYLTYQQSQNNSINQFNKFQNFNQYSNSPIYTPPLQQQMNRNFQPIQLNSTPYSNGYQNLIHSVPTHSNNIFQKNINPPINTPQHRIMPQQSPLTQHMQSPQLQIYRGSGFQPAPLQFKTTPFTINQRY